MRPGIFQGRFPTSLGSIFFVAPSASYTIAGIRGGQAYTASDDNDGLVPERALLTIAAALLKCTANCGDIVALLPGTHTQVGATAVSVAGVQIIGLPVNPSGVRGSRVRPAGHRPKAIITQATAATVALALAAADIFISGVTIRPITQAAGITFTTACDRLTIQDCFIDMKTPVGHANTKGIIPTGATQAPDGLQVLNNLFLEGNGGTSCGIALDIGASVNFVVSDNTFQSDGTVASHATWTTASQAQDNCQGVYVNNVVNGGGATITNGFKGITHTGAGIVQFINNLFSVAVTNPITTWAAADVGLLNNYVATVSGGTGGTLVTVST